MRSIGASLQFPIEVGEQKLPGLTLKVSIQADSKYLMLLNQHGYGEQELANYIRARLQDAVDALDGSLPGLIVSNLEEI